MERGRRTFRKGQKRVLTLFLLLFQTDSYETGREGFAVFGGGGLILTPSSSMHGVMLWDNFLAVATSGDGAAALARILDRTCEDRDTGLPIWIRDVRCGRT